MTNAHECLCLGLVAGSEGCQQRHVCLKVLTVVLKGQSVCYFTCLNYAPCGHHDTDVPQANFYIMRDVMRVWSH